LELDLYRPAGVTGKRTGKRRTDKNIRVQNRIKERKENP
jgi:hypothetical protein